jgi:hypothetical protein
MYGMRAICFAFCLWIGLALGASAQLPLPPMPSGAGLSISESNALLQAMTEWTNSNRIVLQKRPSPYFISWPVSGSKGLVWQPNLGQRMWYVETNGVVEGESFTFELPSPGFPPKPGQPRRAFYRFAEEVKFGLRWGPSATTNVAGYLVYISGPTNQVVNVGLTNGYEGALSAKVNWAFRVTAYTKQDDVILESEPSNAVHLAAGGEGLQ